MENQNKDRWRTELEALHALFNSMTSNRRSNNGGMLPGAYSVGFYPALVLARTRNPEISAQEVFALAARYAESMLN
jgi:hypothetical protein